MIFCINFPEILIISVLIGHDRKEYHTMNRKTAKEMNGESTCKHKYGKKHSGSKKNAFDGHMKRCVRMPETEKPYVLQDSGYMTIII